MPKKTVLIIFFTISFTLFSIFLGILYLSSNFLSKPQYSNFPVSPYIILGTIALAAAAVVSLYLWFLFSYLIIKPIKHFSEITKKIAAGNLGTKISYSGNDEFGKLAININTIINNLSQGLQSLANSLEGEIQKEKELALNFVELKKAKAKDDALLGSIGEGVIAINNEKKIILFNRSVSLLTNFLPTEAIGNYYSRILKFEYEAGRETVPDFISAGLGGLFLNISGHLVLVSRNGKKIPVAHILTPIVDQNKQIIGVMVVLKDITNERQLENLKDEFVSIASHELRTPMTAIKGLISMIFEGDYGEIYPGLKEPLSDIASSTNRLIQLVNDMLDVSRIQGGRVKYVLSEIKIADLIQEIINLMKPLATQKGIELRFNQNKEETIYADINKVKQILSNLIGNALKFTDKGFIEIIYHSQNTSLLISVRDTGMGIMPEDQKKLFSKFQQITSAQMGRPVGSGLGLYISREFARKMGGDLWVSFSTPDQGSVFSFSVPLANTQLAKIAEDNIMN